MKDPLRTDFLVSLAAQIPTMDGLVASSIARWNSDILSIQKIAISPESAGDIRLG
jgi:hypothetical protein